MFNCGTASVEHRQEAVLSLCSAGSWSRFACRFISAMWRRPFLRCGYIAEPAMR